MHTAHTGNKLHLYWRKIALSLTLLIAFQASAQNNPTDNLIGYDNQWIHYGFLLGLHSSKYVINYSEQYIDSTQLHSIVPGNLGGFKVGFLANMKISQYLDFRGSITVGFYENDLLYRMTDGSTLRELKDATMVEIPLLLKYKSARRGNVAAYMLAGINPSIEAAGSTDERDVEQKLELRNWNVAIELGFGLDLYRPFFKFSPEIRYSYGLRNMLTDEVNDFSAPLDKLTTQNLTLFLTFEGGPENKRKLGKKTKGAGKLKARKKK